MEDMQAIAQGEFHEYTQRKRPRDLAWLPRPPELRLLCCGYSCTIYEKGCKGDYSANRMTEETAYEGQPRFDTENKIDQDLHYYT